jgi:peroxiredoxin
LTEYQSRGVNVAVVLAQRAAAVRRYFRKHPPEIAVLVDDSREVTKAYGVWHRYGWDALNIAHPAVFVIDRTGRVRALYVTDSQHEFPAHDDIQRELDAI